MAISIDLYRTGSRLDGGSPFGGALWRANEPSGMLALEPRDFATQAELGWGDPGSTNFRLITDSTSTYGGNDAGQVVFPLGFTGGSAPSGGGAISSIWANNSEIWNGLGSREVYVCFEILFSPNWQAHPTGTNKIFFITIDGFGGGGDPCFLSLETNLESGTAPPQFMVRPQGTGGGIDSPSTSLIEQVEIIYGQHYLVEACLKANTGAALPDGELHLWVNGTKTQEDLSCIWANSDNELFDNVRWEPTWGGAGGTVIEEMYQEISKIHVGVK